jgi:prepilin-type N-terminal cleavage/methylation domain-containing protein
MRNESGLTLAELMIAIAIIAILGTLAVPNMMGWREKSKFNGAVENLRGDLELAKILGVRENGFVAVHFLPDGYQVFTDTGPNAGDLDAGERLIENRVLPAGVSIDLGLTDFAGDKFTRFNERGLPENSGTVAIAGPGGDLRFINLNRLGRIDVQ